MIAQSIATDTPPISPAPDHREAFLHWEASTRDCIDLKRRYVQIAGDHVAGTLLAQLVYWNLPSNRGEIHRLSIEREGKFWLAKGRTDWGKECEISPKQVDRARKVLVNLDLIRVERWRRRGSPMLHWNLDTENLLTAVKALESPGPCNVSPGEIGICPKGKLEFAQRGNSLRPKTVFQREKSKPEISPSHPPLFDTETETPRTGFQLDEGIQTEKTDPCPQLPTDAQPAVCALENECDAPALPAPTPAIAQEEPAEAYEALYHMLSADEQVALRGEAIARLIKKSYHPDFLGMLILTEVCSLLAAQTGGCVAAVPLASAVGTTPSPARERPTRPPEKPKAPLPAPTRSHLVIEDLEDISRLLVVYNHAIDRGEVGRSEPERLKFCAEAKHAIRCGDNPPALFADNLKSQRWQYDQSDEDTARRQLTAHLYGCGAPRSSPPPPRSAPPTLSRDAWVVREVHREMVRHGVQEGAVWSFLRHEHHWTQERCDTIAHELTAYQQACQQGAALGHLGVPDMQDESQAAPFPTALECTECGAVGAACACLDGEDV